VAKISNTKRASPAEVREVFEPQTPSTKHWSAEVRWRSVARNFRYQICVIGGPKFDQCLSAYIWVKPDCLIEELFYLIWGDG